MAFQVAPTDAALTLGRNALTLGAVAPVATAGPMVDAAPTLGRNALTLGRLAPTATASAMVDAAVTLNRNALVPFKADITFQAAMGAGTLGVLAGTVGYATS